MKAGRPHKWLVWSKSRREPQTQTVAKFSVPFLDPSVFISIFPNSYRSVIVYGFFSIWSDFISYFKRKAKISSFCSWSSLLGRKMGQKHIWHFQLEIPSCLYLPEATFGVFLLLQSRSQFWGRIFASPSYHLNNFYFKKFYHYLNQQAVIY